MPITVERAALDEAIAKVAIVVASAKDRHGHRIGWILQDAEIQKALCAMLTGLTPTALPDIVLPEDVHHFTVAGFSEDTFGAGDIELNLTDEDLAIVGALDEDTREVSTRLDGREGRAAARCETGEPYVTYALGGLKREGTPWPIPPKPTAEEALAAWREATALLRHPKVEGERLYWRRLPRLSRTDKGYMITARFRLTAKPETKESENAA